MYFELKENRPHGTPENPFSQYHISDVKRAFQIPVHWHDELEIIYVKQGKLHVTISGENYIGSPKDTFVVSPGSLHFMGSPTGDADYYTFLRFSLISVHLSLSAARIYLLLYHLSED